MPRIEHLRRYGIRSTSIGRLSPEDSGFRDSATEHRRSPSRWSAPTSRCKEGLEIQQSTALIKLNRLTVASMARRGGVTDLLSLPLVRVRERRPAARFLTWYQTAMPERDQSHFHVNISKMG